MFTVIEGLDGCGKSTQVALTEKYFAKKAHPLKRIKLPDYESDSSALVKMYLEGKFGSEPSDVNIYAAAAFYAVDRYANYKLKWKNDYERGADILADRYTTSNAIYQTAKLKRGEWDAYLEWLSDFEYNKIGVPQPDLVIFLDMPVEISQRLMTKRYNGNEIKKDVHEKNIAFLNFCREAALYTAKKWKWIVIPCADSNGARAAADINRDIIKAMNFGFGGIGTDD